MATVCGFLYLFPTVVQKTFFFCVGNTGIRKEKLGMTWHKSCDKRKTLILSN